MVAVVAPAGPPETAVGQSVEVARLSHRFTLRGRPLPVLDAIDLTAEPGELIALLGPSGCGKSTLLRLIAGLDRPTEGDIRTDGKPISGPDPSRILVFQDPTLYPWRTVRRNVSLGLEARGIPRPHGARVDAILKLVGLDCFDEAYPHQLSGGMAQRVALARALVNEPSVMLLDEPFGRLDSLTRMEMQGELIRIWRRRLFTGILVTHDVEEALLLSSRVIVLGPRPARVVAQVAVDLPYPRRRGDARLAELRRVVLETLGVTCLL